MDDYIEMVMQAASDDLCIEWLEFNRCMAQFEECQVMPERFVFH